MNRNEPRGYRGSTSTGEYGESSEFVRELAKKARANQPLHRSQVLWLREDMFAVHCRTCGYLPGASGDKPSLEMTAKKHEGAPECSGLS